MYAYIYMRVFIHMSRIGFDGLQAYGRLDRLWHGVQRAVAVCTGPFGYMLCSKDTTILSILTLAETSWKTSLTRCSRS